MNATETSDPPMAPRGLKGLVVSDTTIGDVRGSEGFYHYRQYSAIELAERVSLEDVWYLMLDGKLPTAAELAAFRSEITAARRIPDDLRAMLAAIAAAGTTYRPLDGLRTALSALAGVDAMRPVWDTDPAERRRDGIRICALTPVLLAALHRLRHGAQPLEPRADLSYAASYLYLLTGVEPAAAHARALERYLVSTVDHGFNASTFTARVIASTGADVAAAVIGALGALSGPLHGGAPSRALDTLDAIGTPDRVDSWVRDRILAGDRIMGFGHPVYRTEDPRSRMLGQIAREFGGPRVELATLVERRVLALLAELKPGRALHTNVEFYAGVVMELVGIPRDMFTPTFAASRVIGWCANVLEQAADTAIIRPSARYVGPAPPQPVPTSA